MNNTTLLSNYKKALKEAFRSKKDVLLLEVETYSNGKYKQVFLTSFCSEMKLCFATGNFVEDFNNAITKGKQLIESEKDKYKENRFEESYNNFSGGIFLSSTFDDYASDNDYTVNYDDLNNVISVSE